MTVTAQTPPPLKPGDTIGVFAPSSFVERDYIEKSKTALEAIGYKVFIHPQTYERHHQSAGDHLQKSLAFQGLWQRADIAAVWAAGGGNRALHLLNTINFDKIKEKPKWLIGFSDVTALLNTVTARAGIMTAHGPVFKSVHRYAALPALMDLLSGKPPAPWALTADNILHPGTTEGHLIGGNLSIFQYLTLPDTVLKGAILFLEDCNEELSKIDRMLLHLRRTGVFEKCAGLMLGEFTTLTETGRPFGFTLHDLLREHTEGLNIPVLMDLPFGHGQNLSPLILGRRARIDTADLTFRML